MTCSTSWPSPLSFKQKITGSNPVHVTISRAISRPTLPGVVILRYAQNLFPAARILRLRRRLSSMGQCGSQRPQAVGQFSSFVANTIFVRKPLPIWTRGVKILQADHLGLIPLLRIALVPAKAR
jgi:hypothetical protein